MLANKKKEVLNEDMEALIADEILRIPSCWRLEYLNNIVSDTVTMPLATVRISVQGETKQDVSSALEPMDAGYNTIVKIIGSWANQLHFGIGHSISDGMNVLGEVTVRLGEDGLEVCWARAALRNILGGRRAAKACLNGLNHLESTRRPQLRPATNWSQLSLARELLTVRNLRDWWRKGYGPAVVVAMKPGKRVASPSAEDL